jgi:hypothetical protein
MSDTVLTALIGALATLVAAVIGVAWKRSLEPKEAPDLSTSREALQRKSHKFDVFVSAPMAAYETDAEVKADHDRIEPVVAYLEDQLSLSVYWAGRHIRSKADFHAPDISATKDVEALLDSRFFLLLYPARIASSVLFRHRVAQLSDLNLFRSFGETPSISHDPGLPGLQKCPDLRGRSPGRPDHAASPSWQRFLHPTRARQLTKVPQRDQFPKEAEQQSQAADVEVGRAADVGSRLLPEPIAHRPL